MAYPASEYRLRRLLLLCAAITLMSLATGCRKCQDGKADPFKNLDAVLTVGMTENEVIALLGKPAATRGDRSFTVFVYPVDSWPEPGQLLEEETFKYVQTLNGTERAILEYTVYFRYGKYVKYDTSGITLNFVQPRRYPSPASEVKTPLFQLRWVEDSASDITVEMTCKEITVDADGNQHVSPAAYNVSKSVVLDHQAVKSAKILPSQVVGTFNVLICFTSAARKSFAEETANNFGKRMAIILEGRILSVARVWDTISNGELCLPDDFDKDEAERIVSLFTQPTQPEVIRMSRSVKAK